MSRHLFLFSRIYNYIHFLYFLECAYLRKLLYNVIKNLTSTENGNQYSPILCAHKTHLVSKFLKTYMSKCEGQFCINLSGPQDARFNTVSRYVCEVVSRQDWHLNQGLSSLPSQYGWTSLVH